VGAKILNLVPISLTQMKTLELNIELGLHYIALWLGCLIIGSIFALSSFFVIRIIWRRQVQSEWSDRQKRRLKTKTDRASQK